MRKLTTVAVGLVSLLAHGFGTNVSATEAADDDMLSIKLDELVVTARRREESAESVPVSITAVTGKDLQSRSSDQMSDIAKETPSLTILARAADPNTQIVSLRGQVQTDASATLDPSVGIYLNDIYVSRNNGSNFDLFDVDRVEVLAGPQGTLYGRNTTGGAIKIITTQADPRGKLNGYAMVGGGNFDSRRIEGAVNIPINDQFAVRLAGLNATRDGYSKVIVGSLANPLDGASTFTPRKTVDPDDKNTTAARLSAVLDATDKLTFSLVSDYSRQRTNGTLGYDKGATLVAASPPIASFGNYTKCSNDFYTSCLNFAPRSEAETRGVGLTTSYDTKLGTAKLIYGYRDVDGFYNTDLDGSPLELEALVLPTKTRQNTVEAQFQGQTSAFDYTVGLYYFNESGDEGFSDTGALIGGTRIINGQVDNESQSIYGQTSYNLTKTVRLTAGARYTRDDKSLEGTAFLQPNAMFPTGLCVYGDAAPNGTPPVLTPNPTSANCRNAQDDSFNHLSWTVGLDWQVRDGLLTYIKASDGYRSGGQNVRGITAQTTRPFKEETIRDVELGLKSRFSDRLRLNLTYYHSRYSDIQTTQFQPIPFPQNATTFVINQGAADIDGVELQSVIVASDNVSFDLTGSYNNFDYEQNRFISQFAPKYKGSVGANFAFPVGYGEWTGRVSYAYQDSFRTTNATNEAKSIPEATSGSRGLLDARVSVNLQDYDLSVSLFGTNLTDKEYFELGTIFSVPVPGAPADAAPIDVFNRVSVGMPRMYGLELRKRF